MRTWRIGILGAVAAVVGWAGIAQASANIDLLWNGTSDAISGVSTSSNLTLHVILTAGPKGSMGAGVSIDYSDAIGKVEMIGFSSTGADSIFPIVLGSTYDTGSAVRNVNGACLPGAGLGSCLGAGESYLLGTLTFHKIDGAGSFEVIPLTIMGPPDGTDAILDLDGNDISSTSTLNVAYFVNPEPGTASLLMAGLVGIAAARRRAVARS
ncbi:MAG TPA: PEP-CTERM sorting domain-containing protein [Myxococcota bacterium]